MKWLRRRYGAPLPHLLLMLASFAVAGYAVTRILTQGGLIRVVLWFGLGLFLHDVVGWPLYTWADRFVIRTSGRHAARVPWINHVRVPVVISGVLLAISFPLVFRLSAGSYATASGLSESAYLGHWLSVVGVLFATSGILYVVRLVRARHRSSSSPVVK